MSVMPKHDVLVIGSLNADLVVRTPRFPQPGETIRGEDLQIIPGGKGANQAVAAATGTATTAAGDAFLGGFAFQMMEQASLLHNAVRYACACGALAVTKFGA